MWFDIGCRREWTRGSREIVRTAENQVISSKEKEKRAVWCWFVGPTKIKNPIDSYTHSLFYCAGWQATRHNTVSLMEFIGFLVF